MPSAKKLTGASGPLSGAYIPLHSAGHARALGIAEGIETALAACCASGVPTVAAYCADNLAAFGWPAGVQRLVIFADNDDSGVGQRAAGALRARAVAAGLHADVLTPSRPGSDWCDVWAGKNAVEASI